MIKFIFGIIAVALLALISQLYFPWWIIAPTSFIIGAALGLNGFKSFAYGFLGVALLWGIYAGMINAGNEGILASRMSTMFGDQGAFSMVLMTALTGGLVAGLAALTGSLGRRLVVKS